MPALAVTNLGALYSGDIDRPTLDHGSLVIEDGVIVALGDDARVDDADVVLDANGASLLPGLIDNHVHPVFGDFTPRVSQSGYIEGFTHGGVTSIVSAGEVHTPGRPKDREGTKALAVLAHKAWKNAPVSARVHGGALLLEPGLVESDFAELAALGVHLVGEIGISGVQDVDEAAEMTRWAQAAGMTVMVHVGGTSVPGSRTIDGPFCVTVQPDVAGHLNGGPTATTLEDAHLILDETEAFIELVYNGNQRAARDIAAVLGERDDLHRLVLGTDSPAGQGIAPAGIFRLMNTLCAMAGLAPEAAIAAATGNTAGARRIPGGRIEIGAVGDVVIADAPDGSTAADLAAALSTGDTPSVAAVVVGGEHVVTRSRVTAPPRRPTTVR